MLKRVVVTAVVGTALFGAVSTGLLARHKLLRHLATEAVRFDLDVLVGG
jgi:hypothetical protein